MKAGDEAIEVLPGELRRIAEVAGLDAAVRIARAFGGECVYVPRLGELARRARDEVIRSDYRSGTTARKLARRYGLTDRQIRKIVRTPDVESLPRELLDLLVDN